MNKTMIPLCAILVLGTSVSAQPIDKSAEAQNAIPFGRILDAKGNVLAEPLPPLISQIRLGGEKRDDLVLTINGELQKIADEEVGKAATEWKAESVMAVMVDPKTGTILAAAQWPIVDANGGKAKDYLAQFQFEPGSILKGLTMAIALDHGCVVLDRQNDGTLTQKLFRLPDAGKKNDTLANKDAAPQANGTGAVAADIPRVKVGSSGLGSARLLERSVPPAMIYEGFRNFGLGSSTGIGITTEFSGKLKPPQLWSGVSRDRIPAGYEILVTPLQIVQAYAAIANQGNLVPLRLIDRVRDPRDHSIISNNPLREIRKVAGEQAIADAICVLRRNTQENLNTIQVAGHGYSVAGKSGASRKYIEGQGDSNDRYYCSFVGFVPVDHPAFVMLVIINDPNNGRKPYLGSLVAAPVFKRIAEKALPHLDVKPDVVRDKK
jgi:cell division protein FtsI/penicillin-binding protein 2